MNEQMVSKIREHYEHAKEKHPYFCDLLEPQLDKAVVSSALELELKDIRKEIAEDIGYQQLIWDTLLNCEVWEIHEAMVKGDTAHAVEECYDAIAVLLRVVDVLEGRQALGDPAKGGAK